MSDDAKIDDLAIHLYAQDLRLSRIRPGSLLAERDHYLVAKIKTPTLVISGDRDPVGHPSVEAQAAEFLRARPDARVEILKDTGHWAMYEAPDRVNQLLSKELA
jgi:pimeloyl-ACP methyl ester carboxylesterase